MDRLKLAVAIALGVLTGSPCSHAAYTVPAVNLPAQTPDIVRDRVARSLASNRDTVGRVLHPFHGEFHGLGAFSAGGNYVTDLSADGRVVVGYDNTLAAEARPFVWSPATGKVNYSMLPSGATGNSIPTTISADGVYVGGNVRSGYNSSSGFLWSLAGSQAIPSSQAYIQQVSSLSGDGKIVVGRQSWRTPPIYQDSGSYFSFSDEWAYRYTRGGGSQTLGTLPAFKAGSHPDSDAIDVSYNGKTVLFNGTNRANGFRVEPYLWREGGGVNGLGNFVLPSHDIYNPFERSIDTYSLAISADGFTVVGSAQPVFWVGRPTEVIWQRAVYWRAETGWTDLGELKSPPNHRPIVGYEATGVSGDGSVVIGHANLKPFVCDCQYNPSYKIPFHWDEARGMRDLGDVLRYDYGLDLADWSFYDLAGISDDGTTIIGNGLSPDRKYEGWRAVMQRNTPLGDIDFDGDVDPQDYAQLTSNLGATAANGAVYYADGDLNADGRVDQSDAATLLGLYQGRRQGDFNADGFVNIADYTLWRDHVGQYTGGLADSNGDGWVNQTDLATWRTNFGRAIGSLFPFSIPEPAAATLLASAFLCVSRRR